MAEANSDSGSTNLITVKVKTTRETLELRIPTEATVGDVSILDIVQRNRLCKPWFGS